MTDKILENLSEINLIEYKIMADITGGAFVQHETDDCDRIYIRNVTDAYELLVVVRRHHNKYHKNRS